MVRDGPGRKGEGKKEGMMKWLIAPVAVAAIALVAVACTVRLDVVTDPAPDVPGAGPEVGLPGLSSKLSVVLPEWLLPR